MQDSHLAINSFYGKIRQVLALHQLEALQDIKFSGNALNGALIGSFDDCAREFQEMLIFILKGKLSSQHIFIQTPYVRQITLSNGDFLNILIVKQQSLEWYGREDSISAFDFLYESQRGVFSGCKTFLDLGGHQLVWSIFYAKTSESAEVLAFEPSVLNALIGLFDCFVNGVINRVNVVPFAVVAKQGDGDNAKQDREGEKMLIDFMTLPLKICNLDEYVKSNYDFVKTDIEGYEYELLADPTYCKVVRNAKYSHFELHLGHLIHRGIDVEACVKSMKQAGFEGTELYSKLDMYDFLKTCNRTGFYSFLIDKSH